MKPSCIAGKVAKRDLAIVSSTACSEREPEAISRLMMKRGAMTVRVTVHVASTYVPVAGCQCCQPSTRDACSILLCHRDHTSDYIYIESSLIHIEDENVPPDTVGKAWSKRERIHGS